jgi:hypothetical protein
MQQPVMLKQLPQAATAAVEKQEVVVHHLTATHVRAHCHLIKLHVQATHTTCKPGPGRLQQHHSSARTAASSTQVHANSLYSRTTHQQLPCRVLLLHLLHAAVACIAAAAI